MKSGFDPRQSMRWSLPIGITVAIIYAKLSLKYKSWKAPYMAANLDAKDVLIMIQIILAFTIIFFIIQIVQFRRTGRKNFNPFLKKDVISDSTDKQRAKYHSVPKKYLSETPDGLTVGYYDIGPRKMYVRLPFQDSPDHQLILGSPGSNKSTTLLNALIFNYNYANRYNRLCSVLAIDAKPELSKKSVDESRNDVKIINPTTYGTYGFDVWYGLSEDSSDDEIKERAEAIARALIPRLSGDNAFFSDNAQKILSGCLMFGYRKGYSFTDSIIKVMESSVDNLIAEIVSDPDMKKHPKILHKIKGFDGNKSDGFASIKDTLEKDLDIFDVDTVKHCFSDSVEKVTPYDLANGTSIYLAIPDHLLTQYRTVFGMIMELCLKYLTSIPEEDLERRRPVWCLVDEGGTIYVPSLLDVASRGRSKKIQLSIVAQSYSQLEDLYGDCQARSILDCCKTTVVFSCNDTRTARDLSSWTGLYRETKLSTRLEGYLARQAGRNASEEYRPVIEVADIKKLEKDNEVLVFTKGDWFLVKKAPFYVIDEFKTISERLYAENIRRSKGNQKRLEREEDELDYINYETLTEEQKIWYHKEMEKRGR